MVETLQRPQQDTMTPLQGLEGQGIDQMTLAGSVPFLERV